MATFVSDLTAIESPLGASTPAPADFRTDFVVSAEGNVTQITHPNTRDQLSGQDGRWTVQIEYNEPFKQISKETNEVGDVVTYSDYDANGLPQVMTDGRGNETAALLTDGRSIYHYDTVGNLLTETDPRGGIDGTVAENRTGTKYTTTFAYDKLDRLVSAQIPRASTQPADHPERFSTRSWEYDDNDNLRFYTDMESRRFERRYTAMDMVERELTPEVQHAADSNPATYDAPAREETAYQYDAVDNLLKVTRPKGTATPAVDDFTTGYDYDEVNRRVAMTRFGAGAADKLVTSFAYDRRDNLVGVVDPATNRAIPRGDPRGERAQPAAAALRVRDTTATTTSSRRPRIRPAPARWR